MLTATDNLAGPIDRIQPYMTLGAGMYFMASWMEIGMYTYNNSTTHFGLMPGLELKFRMDRKSSLDVQVDYNAAFDSGTNLAGGDDNSYSWIGLKVGFTYGR
ncbi:MAG: hypothetical protein HYX66_09245 [Ignavibacteria bacterium]|nr:hypothetical protein [Ignavibacteria bacterium]